MASKCYKSRKKFEFFKTIGIIRKLSNYSISSLYVVSIERDDLD